ncbi:MAG: hypothetical protein ACM3QW_00020 [Ignavibacteriales bacterium]
MKDKKKRRIFPRSLIKSLSEDIKSLAQTSEGRLLALEIIDEIPQDLRAHVIDGLSSFHSQEIVDFFCVIKKEYGKELEAACNRGLEKFQMAGMKIDLPDLMVGEFFKAYVTRTRHTGQITLDVAWKDEEGLLDVECFFLSYNPDGVHGFFVISEMPIPEYQADRQTLPDMIEISLDEACSLVKEAHEFNVRYMTRPALGRFLYNKYLEHPAGLKDSERTKLLTKITPELEPQELINTFFYALRYKDEAYISSIGNAEKGSLDVMNDMLELMMSTQYLLVEGQALEAKIARGRGLIKAYSIHAEKEELFRSDFTFFISEENKRWFITGLHRDALRVINESREGTPFQDKVHCLVYEILDLDQLFEVLEEIEDIREVGELPFGVHLRVTDPEEDVSTGVFFLTGVMADIVINGDELVIIAQNEANALGIEKLIVSRSNSVGPVSRYQTEIITAYSYLNGQYMNFDDMLDNENDEVLFEDGLKFLTARYLFKDRDRVLDKLDLLKGTSYCFPGDYDVFYEFEGDSQKALMAEYVIGDNWITVSAFDQELTEVREKFENGLRDCLEFEGMEIKCEGVFELITSDVKKQYPFLEPQLKDAYLCKWFGSNLKPLRGLSPRDAAKSVDGKRMLWGMFKDMKRKEKMRQEMGVKNGVELKDYIKKVDIKQEHKL